ncbi:hypothetical protein JMJ77_0003408 [Colletotrichum scovillei]|uniref:Uncharacterized protein n=1 Tax=Colletotrichum scovillei TaxID=1209932 RepID=A0A9P7QVY7_9PEZI|nr:hypothetical protein JMJ78_0004947 [Colletotrichum scovillei]KAG7041301.1 hypothetical protein JMJ77_0003408 [Colletotrichum scovillei]KAG7061330.1 hypothetical protein JMJ76_0000895 [Colletotrichum scovillei]
MVSRHTICKDNPIATAERCSRGVGTWATVDPWLSLKRKLGKRSITSQTCRLAKSMPSAGPVCVIPISSSLLAGSLSIRAPNPYF